MHLSPSELRVVQRDGLLLRFGILGPVIGALAELPASGSLDTTLERPCIDAHRGVVLRGELELERAGIRRTIGAGDAFYVPAGEPGHRFFAARRALLAGFVPLGDPDADRILAESGSGAELLPDVIASSPAVSMEGLAPGEIRASATVMGHWVLTQATMGPLSGYGTGYCDASHSGVVIAGGGAIEYEDDVEVLGSGDLYHVPAGPPGHRVEAADGIVLADVTPLDELHGRLAEWRETIRASLPRR